MLEYEVIAEHGEAPDDPGQRICEGEVWQIERFQFARPGLVCALQVATERMGEAQAELCRLYEADCADAKSAAVRAAP